MHYKLCFNRYVLKSRSHKTFHISICIIAAPPNIFVLMLGFILAGKIFLESASNND